MVVSFVALAGLLGTVLAYFQVIRYREMQLNYRTELKARQAGLPPQGEDSNDIMQLLQYLPMLQQMQPPKPPAAGGQ